MCKVSSPHNTTPHQNTASNPDKNWRSTTQTTDRFKLFTVIWSKPADWTCHPNRQTNLQPKSVAAQSTVWKRSWWYVMEQTNLRHIEQKKLNPARKISIQSNNHYLQVNPIVWKNTIWTWIWNNKPFSNHQTQLGKRLQMWTKCLKLSAPLYKPRK